MNKPILGLSLASLLLAACASPAAACPRTQAAAPDAVSIYGDPDGLQVLIYGDGIWHGLPEHARRFTQKVWWSHPDYVWTEEESPDFVLIAEEVNGDGYFFQRGQATNARLAELGGSAILTGVELPAGCWQITGLYRDSEQSFIAWIQD